MYTIISAKRLSNPEQIQQVTNLIIDLSKNN